MPGRLVLAADHLVGDPVQRVGPGEVAQAAAKPRAPLGRVDGLVGIGSGGDRRLAEGRSVTGLRTGAVPPSAAPRQAPSMNSPNFSYMPSPDLADMDDAALGGRLQRRFRKHQREAAILEADLGRLPVLDRVDEGRRSRRRRPRGSAR